MEKCPHCGLIHGPRCPSVKAIEYFPDGTVKRVEYLTPADCWPPQFPSPNPEPGYPSPWQPSVTYGVPSPSPCDVVFGPGA